MADLQHAQADELGERREVLEALETNKGELCQASAARERRDGGREGAGAADAAGACRAEEDGRGEVTFGLLYETLREAVGRWTNILA